MSVEDMLANLNRAFWEIKAVCDELEDKDGTPKRGKKHVWAKLDNILGTLYNIATERELE